MSLAAIKSVIHGPTNVLETEYTHLTELLITDHIRSTRQGLGHALLGQDRAGGGRASPQGDPSTFPPSNRVTLLVCSHWPIRLDFDMGSI